MNKAKETEKEKKTTKSTQKTPSKQASPAKYGLGRRKTAKARVWLRRGSGKATVNGQDLDKYFDTAVTRLDAATPFRVVPIASSYDVEVNICGGGKCGQAGAVKLGIARALLQIDESLRPLLRKHGLLTVDSRQKERKKYGQKGARAKFQFAKR